MGSYASQVTPKQRWMIVSYIKSKQQAAKPAGAAAGGAAAPAGKDSAAGKNQQSKIQQRQKNNCQVLYPSPLKREQG